MRVFIFGTGRCGTVSIAAALKHATNYTVEHEGYSPDWQYPDHHIEVNPQLRAVVGGWPMEDYRNDMFVWLQRDREKVADSYRRLDGGMWLDYWWEICPTVRPRSDIAAARIAVEWIEKQCFDAFRSRAQTQRVILGIDRIKNKDEFPALWSRIGAIGELAAALRVFDTPMNTSAQRGDG